MEGGIKHKVLSTILFATVCTLIVNCQTNPADKKVKSCKSLTVTEAERILGGSVELVAVEESSSIDKKRLECTYRKVEKEKASTREAVLYFMSVESPTDKRAKQLYDEIWNSNKDHQGIEILSDIGDQAYAHSDKSNFHFVMVRKGKFTIRMKVNKAVETTSFDELKAFAKRVGKKEI